MYLYKIFLFLLFLLFIISSCNENITETKNAEDSYSGTYSLKKTTWYTSAEQSWPHQPDNVTGGSTVCYSWDEADQIFEFTYRGYNFKFKKPDGSKDYLGYDVQMYINNEYVKDISWEFDDDFGNVLVYLPWESFDFDGKNMEVQLRIQINTHDNNCTYNYTNTNSPRFVTVKIEETYLEGISGFSVSPTMHNNLNQTVSISWTSSTDPDVTGYEIYRNKYYLARGQLRNTGFQLVKTFTSRTVSSWYDNPGWGTNPHLGIGYYYKIRAIDSTHNLKSNFSSVKMSYLEDYDNILP